MSIEPDRASGRWIRITVTASGTEGMVSAPDRAMFTGCRNPETALNGLHGKRIPPIGEVVTDQPIVSRPVSVPVLMLKNSVSTPNCCSMDRKRLLRGTL